MMTKIRKADEAALNRLYEEMKLRPISRYYNPNDRCMCEEPKFDAQRRRGDTSQTGEKCSDPEAQSRCVLRQNKEKLERKWWRANVKAEKLTAKST